MDESDNCHVCIVTYHMIPNTRIWGASQRMYYLANQLVDSGFDTTVVSGFYGEFKHEGKCSNFEHIPVLIKPDFIQAHQEKLAVKSATDGEVKAPKKLGFKSYILENLVKPVYRAMERLLFNDYGAVGLFMFLWNRQALPVISEEIVKRNTKIIIFSGPYFTCFRLAFKIKKIYPHIKIVLDYRDPWNLLKKGSFITNKLEHKLLQIADSITYFSEKFLDAMHDRYEIERGKGIVMYNGFDNALWNSIDNGPSQSRSDKLVITYAGSDITFEPGSGRDPDALIRAVTGSLFNEHIVLNLVGCKNQPEKNKYGNNSSNINFLPRVSHKRSLEILSESDVVVILSSDEFPSDYTVTGKLFDGIRSGAYILGIANSREIDYKKIIEKEGLGTGCYDDVSEIQNELTTIYKSWQDGTLDRDIIKNTDDFSRISQNSKLINQVVAWSNEKYN